MENPFLQFKTETKEVQIEALNGATISLQQPTISQTSDFSRGIFDGKNEDGTPKLDYGKVFEANLIKISVCMVEPKMSVEDLRGLSSSADKAIAEIISSIDNWDGVEDEDEAGN